MTIWKSGECKVVGRRSFLLSTAVLASSGSLALTACTGNSRGQQAGTPMVAGATGPLPTVDEFIARQRFAIAHRGSGDTWPEHTLTAYQNSINAGAQAIEISVQATSDGILVCHHDDSLLRTTGTDRLVRDTTYVELSAMRVDARSWLGQATPFERIPRLKDVLDAVWGKAILFVEDKSGRNADRILDMLAGYEGMRQRVIWKQAASSGSYKAACAKGLLVWGYFVNNDNNKFERYQERFAVLGLYRGASDDEVRQLLSYGKPVILWELHRRSDVDRAIQLGVQGLMCANYSYLTQGVHPGANTDSFASGQRAAGDLPFQLNPDFQPRLSRANQAAIFEMNAPTTYQLGSLGPVTGNTYTLQLSLSYPTGLPENGGAGMAFGAQTDSPLLVAGEDASCLLVQLKPDGDLSLFERRPGGSDKALISVATRPLRQGEWAEVKVQVNNGTATLSRAGDSAWSATKEVGAPSAGYLSLIKGYPGTTAVSFRSVKVDR